MAVRGIQGATVVERDSPDHVIAATRELLDALVRASALTPDDVISAIFTATPDLRSEYPARAARVMGWTDVPLLGATEMDLPTGLPRCMRVLLHVDTDRTTTDIKHIYLRGAAALRPDRAMSKGTGPNSG